MVEPATEQQQHRTPAETLGIKSRTVCSRSSSSSTALQQFGGSIPFSWPTEPVAHSSCPFQSTASSMSRTGVAQRVCCLSTMDARERVWKHGAQLGYLIHIHRACAAGLGACVEVVGSCVSLQDRGRVVNFYILHCNISQQLASNCLCQVHAQVYPCMHVAISSCSCH